MVRFAVVPRGGAPTGYRSGLQPSGVLLGRLPGALPQAGIGRASGPLFVALEIMALEIVALEIGRLEFLVGLYIGG